MSTGIAPHRPPPSIEHTASRYEQAWTCVSLLAAAAWIAVAFVQTPMVPLLALAIANAAWGGIFFVRAPASSLRARSEYLGGVVAVAGLVLTLVGISHHVEIGMATIALLAGTSPSLLRRAARRAGGPQRREHVVDEGAPGDATDLPEPLGAEYATAQRRRQAQQQR